MKQAELWEREVQKDKKVENSWFNYYRACRNAHGSADWKSDFIKESPSLKFGEQIVDSMKVYIPNTFTYYFVAGSTGAVVSDGELLMKAYRINPDFEGIHATIATYATSTFNKELRKEVNQRWFKRNELSIGLINYAYNVLMSLAPNGIILTENDNDTYPLWLLQDAKNIRLDVMVINIDFLLYEDYRKKIFADLNIKPLALGTIDLNQYAMNWEKVVHHFATAYQIDRPLYIAMSLAPERYKGLEANLSIAGLAYEYNKSKTENISWNKKLFEDKFLLNYLHNQLYHEVSSEFVDKLNVNYLPLLKICRQYYEKNKLVAQIKKVDKIASLILNKIADPQTKLSYQNDFYKK